MGAGPVNVTVWERHARARIAAGDLLRPPGPPRFSWTRTGTGDPGAALLGDVTGKRVVELGCGTGDNLAYVVDQGGARGVGVDESPSQIRRARARWPGFDLRCAGAARFLLTDSEPIHVCYSVFGAVGLMPAVPLVTLIRRRLTVPGLLAFSVRAPGRVRATPTLRGTRGRWYLHSPQAWTRLLCNAGFSDVQTRDADTAETPTTLIVTART
ncbi:methyltransferase family protein [Frankia sp. QA3]|nr:methyltransferase family protein [Frankia sp. QA3]